MIYKRSGAYLMLSLVFIFTLIFLLMGAFLTKTPAFAVTQATFYVSPAGSGSTCSLASPCALSAIQTKVRSVNTSMTGDIIVYLRGGTYTLSATFELTQLDSGTNGFNVMYKSYPGEYAVISGGQVITGWTQEGDKWKANVGTTLQTRQLYVNDARAVRAKGGALPGAVKTTAGYTTTDASMQSWQNISDIEFVYNALWTQSRCGVDSIFGTAITMKQPCYKLGSANAPTDTNIPAWIENAYELLDAPGEWYLNHSTGWLYYIPRPGETIANTTVVVPVVETLVKGSGTLAAPIHNISFEGITFAYAGWLTPSGNYGFLDAQANYFVQPVLSGQPNQIVQQLANHAIVTVQPPASVAFSAAKSIQFERNIFKHLGAAGLSFGLGSQSNLISGNSMFDISSFGIGIGDVTSDDSQPIDTRMKLLDNSVTNNYIHRIGVEFAGAPAIFAGYTDNALIAHNELNDLPYTGISMGWGPNLYNNPSIANNNKVRNNRIHDLMKGVVDGGAIYNIGAQPGMDISGNMLYDQPTFSAGHYGAVYLDNDSEHITIQNNVMYNNIINLLIKGNYNTIINNYWDNESHNLNLDTNRTMNNNTIVTNGIYPSSIVNNAGLEAAYQDLLPASRTPVKLTPGSTIVQLGQTLQLSVSGKAATEGLLYKSSDDQAATVDSNGLVTPLKRGKVTISVKALENGVERPSGGSDSVKLDMYGALSELELQNVALNKPVSGWTPDGLTPLSAYTTSPIQNGVDGDANTLTAISGSWAWRFKVDLGRLYTTQSIDLTFAPTLYATQYEILSSIDNVNWESLTVKTNGAGATKFTLTLPTLKTMRYVAVRAIKPDASGQTGTQMGIAELAVNAYEQVALDKVRLAAPSTVVQLGQTLQLSASGKAAAETWVYSSSDTQVATVSQSGLITPLKKDKVTITAKALKNGVERSLDGNDSVTILAYKDTSELALHNVALNKPASGWTPDGLTPLSAYPTSPIQNGVDGDVNTLTAISGSWAWRYKVDLGKLYTAQSIDLTFAAALYATEYEILSSVDNATWDSLTVKTNGAGATKFTLTLPSLKVMRYVAVRAIKPDASGQTGTQMGIAELAVNAYDAVAPDPLKLTPLSTIVELGQTLQMSVSGKTSAETLLYTSSDPEAATVNQSGLVTPLKRGKATISVKALENGVERPSGGSDSVKLDMYGALSELELQNVALNKMASGWTPDGLTPLSAYTTSPIQNGVDGDANTLTAISGSWAWRFKVDLGRLYTTQSIDLTFAPTLYATQYEILSSIDNVNWESLTVKTNGAGATKFTLTLPALKTMRYVAVRAIKPDASGQTGTQMGIAELAVNAYEQVALDKVRLAASSTVVQLGQTLQLSASGKAAAETWVYSSSDTQVATVSQSGLITPLKKDKVTITAKALKNGVERSLDGNDSVTILAYKDTSELALHNVALNKPASGWTPDGLTPLSAYPTSPIQNGVDGDVNTLTAISGSWAWRYKVDLGKLYTAQSIDLTFAAALYATEYEILSSVDNATWDSLTVKTNGAGATKFTLTLPSLKVMRYVAVRAIKPDASGQTGTQMGIAELAVNAYDAVAPDPLTLTPLSTIVQLGQTLQMSVSGKTSAETLLYTSSDPEAATVNQSGLVTPLKRGKVTISVKALENGVERPTGGSDSVIIDMYGSLGSMVLNNVALNKPASGWTPDGLTPLSAYTTSPIQNGVDGDANTLTAISGSWAWRFKVDLGRLYTTQSIDLTFAATLYATQYEILSSMDNVNWDSLTVKTNGAGATKFTLTLPALKTMRYVAVRAIKPDDSGQTGTQMGIAELAVNAYEPVAVAPIRITLPSLSIVQLGQTLQLGTSGKTAAETLVYTISNSPVATVSQSGLVIPVKKGRVTVRVKALENGIERVADGEDSVTLDTYGTLSDLALSNVALNKTASGWTPDGLTPLSAYPTSPIQNGVDGDVNTLTAISGSWAWRFMVDLGRLRTAQSIDLTFAPSLYATQYEILSSTDNVNWDSLTIQTNGTGGNKLTLTLPSLKLMRYVAVRAIKPDASGQTGTQMGIAELAVNGY